MLEFWGILTYFLVSFSLTPRSQPRSLNLPPILLLSGNSTRPSDQNQGRWDLQIKSLLQKKNLVNKTRPTKLCLELELLDLGGDEIDVGDGQAPTGSRISNPRISGTGFCKILGSRDISGQDQPKTFIPGSCQKTWRLLQKERNLDEKEKI